jgi:threonine/homoserine/homoserine lactone efflux protein
MTAANLLLFAGVYFVMVISPGPGIAAVIARGMSQGTRAAPAYIAGFVVGDLVWFTVAATGLSVIAQTFETLFLVIKYLGCCYLLFMAWKIWTAPIETGEMDSIPKRLNHWSSFLGSLSIALGNPKVIIFFLSIMPLVIDLKSITSLVFLEMAAVIVLVFVPTQTAILLLANRARRIFTSRKALKRINRGTAGIMAGTAAVIAARP